MTASELQAIAKNARREQAMQKDPKVLKYMIQCAKQGLDHIRWEGEIADVTLKHLQENGFKIIKGRGIPGVIEIYWT